MAMESVFLGFLLYINPKIGLHSEQLGQCSVFSSSSQIRSCNRVLCEGLPTAKSIQAVRTFFGDVPFSWPVDATDKDAHAILEENGLSLKACFPAMRLDLASLEPLEYAQGITIEDVTDLDAQLASWVEIVADSFEVTSSELHKVITLFKSNIIPGALKLYTAFYQNKPVGASMSLKHDATVSIHWVSTLPVFRNRGVGFAVTHALLLEAKLVGCTQAILLSSQKGKSLYERLGFQEYASYKVYGN